MPVLEAPHTVFRDWESGGIVTVLSLDEVWDMITVARRVVADAKAGSAEAKAAIVAISEIVAKPGTPERGRAIVSACLIKRAIAEAEGTERPEALAHVVKEERCTHGEPLSKRCEKCDAKAGIVANDVRVA
jgi:hypothetical protein